MATMVDSRLRAVTGGPRGHKISVRSLRSHVHPFSARLYRSGEEYDLEMGTALDMVSRGIVSIVDDEVASPVRSVETKEGATVETPAPALSVSKEAAPKRRGPKPKGR